MYTSTKLNAKFSCGLLYYNKASEATVHIRHTEGHITYFTNHILFRMKGGLGERERGRARGRADVVATSKGSSHHNSGREVGRGAASLSLITNPNSPRLNLVFLSYTSLFFFYLPPFLQLPSMKLQHTAQAPVASVQCNKGPAVTMAMTHKKYHYYLIKGNYLIWKWKCMTFLMFSQVLFEGV